MPEPIMALLGRMPDLPVARFGGFELDLRTGELLAGGQPLKVQQQPVRVLAILVSRPGELVTRDELRTLIWGGDTYVDFDQGLNYCIKQIRAALGDQADTPRFVETLPRRGYRFIATVDWADRRGDTPTPVPGTAQPVAAPPAGLSAVPMRRTATEARFGSRVAAGRAWGIAALGLAALAVAGLLGYAAAPRLPAAQPSFQRLTHRRGFVTAARFAADGSVVYSASWDGKPSRVFAVGKGATDTRDLGFTDADVVGATDGELVLRRFQPGFPLERVAAGGGTPSLVAEFVVTADQSRDGKTLAMWRNVTGTRQLELPKDNVVLRDAGGTVDLLRLSPDGGRVAYAHRPLPQDDRGDVLLVDRSGRKTVLSAGWASLTGLAWSPDGSEVWFTAAREGLDCALWGVTPEGRQRLIERMPGRMTLYDAAPDGRVLLARSVIRHDLRVSLDGAPPRDLSWYDVPLLNDVSPDGSTVVFTESGDVGGARYGVFLRGTDGSPPVRVGDGHGLQISPDGRWVLAKRVEEPRFLVAFPVGGGAPRVLPGTEGFQFLSGGWTPDSRRVLFAGGPESQMARVWVQDLGGGGPRPVTPERFTARAILATSDGREVLACGPKEGCAFHPIDGAGAPRPVRGLESLDVPLAWDDTGEGLYVAQLAMPARLDHVDLRTGERKPWRSLEVADPAGVVRISNVQASTRRQAYAYSYTRVLHELYVATGLR